MGGGTKAQIRLPSLTPVCHSLFGTRDSDSFPPANPEPEMLHCCGLQPRSFSPMPVPGHHLSLGFYDRAFESGAGGSQPVGFPSSDPCRFQALCPAGFCPCAVWSSGRASLRTITLQHRCPLPGCWEACRVGAGSHPRRDPWEGAGWSQVCPWLRTLGVTLHSCLAP